MKTYFDCIPCFLRQALDVARLVSNDEAFHERVLRGVLRDLTEMDLRSTPPEMGRRIHRLIRELTGIDDPYREAKEWSNTLALDLLPKLRATVENADDPLETAVRLAIAGNVLDFGAVRDMGESKLHEAIEHALNAPIDGDISEFRDAVNSAADILFLADNAGEIVFDRLLIEQLGPDKTTVVVKGSPVINDATMEDAEASGMIDLVDVIDNGSDVPGTIPEECSEDFRRRFDDAGLIIAKGQGNYETLSDVNKNIFFILKAKCPVIANDIGCEVDSLILRRGN